MANKAPSTMYSLANGTGIKDNGGTVLYGGNIATGGAITNAPDMAIVGSGRKAQPKPVQSAYTGATIANSSGNFAKLVAGAYVVKGGNVTTALAGVAYRGLRGGGNQNQIRGIHTLLTRSTVLITSWNYATGVATKAAGNPSSDDFDINSSYAAPTRAVPGNFVTIEDGKSTTTSAYTGKTG